MNILKEKILTKSNTVHRQNIMRWESINESKTTWNEVKEKLKKYYLQRIPETEEEFFSDNKDLQERGLKGYQGLLILRPWDDIDDTLSKNNENKDKYKHRYVDDFNNFSEFYQFLKSLVKDVEEYHNARINNLDDNKGLS